MGSSLNDDKKQGAVFWRDLRQPSERQGYEEANSPVDWDRDIGDILVNVWPHIVLGLALLFMGWRLRRDDEDEVEAEVDVTTPKARHRR